MTELVAANWWAFVLALVAGIAAAWWLLAARRKARVGIRAFDVLEEGAAPARRNQALIDAPGAPVSPSAAPPAPPAPPGDDLTRIKGLGPRIAALLREMGITSFAQIAAWSEEDIDRIDARLGGFSGRIRRDRWVEQAKLLAGGDRAAFEARFGRL